MGRLLQSLLFLSTCGAAAAKPSLDSIEDPDGKRTAVWKGWIPDPANPKWIKRLGEDWNLVNQKHWMRAGRIWRDEEERIPLGSRGRRSRTFAPVRTYDAGLQATKPILDSSRFWRCEPGLLDTARPFALADSSSIRWTGRYFWTSPDELWAEGELVSGGRDRALVEALLPARLIEQKGTPGSFELRTLKIVIHDELNLKDVSFRAARPLLLAGPPERTVPIVLNAGKNPEQALLRVDAHGFRAVSAVDWTKTGIVAEETIPLRVLSRAGGVTFSVDPVKPNRAVLASLTDSAWKAGFEPRAESQVEWVAGESGSKRLVQLPQTGHSFIDAFVVAWNEHRPVRISPDAIWMLLMEGLLGAVRDRPEAARKEMVLHDSGKILLEAKLDEDFPLQMRRREAWEEVASQLLDSMDRHTVGHRQKELQVRFTTTTATRALATRMRILELYQDFFEYTGSVGCGIPSIRLEGTPADWKRIRAQAKILSIGATRSWVEGMMPVLDQFVAASEGKLDAAFWRAFVRFRPAGPDCGEVDELDGWITRLVLRKSFDFTQDSDSGIGSELTWEHRLPTSVLRADHGSAPFRLSVGASEWSFHFVSGFSGVSQDKDGALAPELGWSVWKNVPPPSKD